MSDTGEVVNPTYLVTIDDGTGDAVRVGHLNGHVVLEVHNEDKGDYFGVLLSRPEALELGLALGIAAKRAGDA